MVRVYYCSGCGRRIPLEEIEEDRVVEADGLIYCAECAEAEMAAVPVEEVEVVPAGPLYCDRCNALIEPADLQSGRAVSAGGQSYCAKCTAMYLPLLEALKAKEEESPEEPVHHRRRTPAYGMRAVSTERAAEPHAPPYESKSNTTAILGAAAGVVVLVIIIAVVLSGGGTAPNPRPDGGTGRAGTGTGTDDPTPYVPKDPVEIPRFTEDPRVRKLIESADSFAEANPESYDAIISRYEEIERNQSLSSTQSSHIRLAISNAVEKRRRKAEVERDRLMVEADKLEKEGDCAGAIAALEKYPAALKSVEECWSQVQARIELLGKDKDAQGPYEVLMMQVDVLKKAQKEKEAIEHLKKFTEEYAGSSFAAKASTLIAELGEVLAKREAEKEKAEQEARERAKAALEALKTGEPLYYADFTSEKLNANVKIRYDKCEYPYPTQSGLHSLRFMEIGATASMEFSLLEKPKLGLLQLSHVVPEHTDQQSYVVLTLKLNDKVIIQNNRYDRGQVQEELQYDISDKLVKGENKLTFSFPSGTVRWDLHKVAIKTFYEGTGWQKEKAEADRSKKAAEEDLAKWRITEKKKIEAERNKFVKKFERGALPALKPGTHDLLKDKSLKGWKIWGAGGEWKVENGVLVGRNNNLSWGSMITPYFKDMDEWRDYTLSFKIKFENSCENQLLLRASYPDALDKLPAEALSSTSKAGAAKMGTIYDVKYVIEGNRMNSWVNGTQGANNFEIPARVEKGFFGWHLGPNATIYVSDIILELKKVK